MRPLEMSIFPAGQRERNHLNDNLSLNIKYVEFVSVTCHGQSSPDANEVHSGSKRACSTNVTINNMKLYRADENHIPSSPSLVTGQ